MLRKQIEEEEEDSNNTRVCKGRQKKKVIGNMWQWKLDKTENNKRVKWPSGLYLVCNKSKFVV